MNYTENYQLPLWDADDAIKRTDFNDANSAIDAAIAGVNEAVGNLIVTGTYTGTADSNNMKQTQAITLGFQPRFLFVRDTSYRGSSTVSDNWTPHQLAFATPEHPHYVYDQYKVIQITETGFTAGGVNCIFNNSDNTYTYLAIR